MPMSSAISWILQYPPNRLHHFHITYYIPLHGNIYSPYWKVRSANSAIICQYFCMHHKLTHQPVQAAQYRSPHGEYIVSYGHCDGIRMVTTGLSQPMITMTKKVMIRYLYIYITFSNCFRDWYFLKSIQTYQQNINAAILFHMFSGISSPFDGRHSNYIQFNKAGSHLVIFVDSIRALLSWTNSN